jgi:RNA polymerase sigma-70 factor (ECF subfamily)
LIQKVERPAQYGSGVSLLRLVHSRSPLPTPEASCLETFEQELDYVFATLQRLGARPADMEDLLQEVFLILHRNWLSLDATRSLRPWLFGVAFRVVRTQRRRRAREIPYDGLDPEDVAPSPEGWVQAQEWQALLSAALLQIPPSRRSVVIQHDLEGLDVIDIARQLSITKFGVYARLYKGRKELAAAVRRLWKEGERK